MARYSLAERNAVLDARSSQFNTGYCRIYSGTRPTDADTSLGAAVLLQELRFNATAFAAAGSGEALANAMTASAAVAAGIPTFARCFASNGTTALCDVSVGKTGGAEELLVSTTDGTNPYIAAGATATVTSFKRTFPVGS